MKTELNTTAGEHSGGSHCSHDLFYAERIGGMGEPYIAERGVFMSIEEFAPYRAKGWEGAKKHNEAADAFISANVKGHASPETAPEFDPTTSSASHEPPC